MAFPTGTISALDIRNELAPNNTAGPQVNISLGDMPVRAAASVPSGPISYGNLHGARVAYSGTILFGEQGGEAVDGNYGYGFVDSPLVDFGTQYTISYFRADPFYNLRHLEYGYFPSIPAFYTLVEFNNNVTSEAVSTIYVTIGTQRYTLTNNNGNPPSQKRWYNNSSTDIFGMVGKKGQTLPVVITY